MMSLDRPSRLVVHLLVLFNPNSSSYSLPAFFHKAMVYVARPNSGGSQTYRSSLPLFNIVLDPRPRPEV